MAPLAVLWPGQWRVFLHLLLTVYSSAVATSPSVVRAWAVVNGEGILRTLGGCSFEA
jgi:hypothetical protein